LQSQTTSTGRSRPRARRHGRKPGVSQHHHQEHHHQARPEPRAGFAEASFDPTPIEFDALDLDDRLRSALATRGFVRTTPVQSATFPLAFAGEDLIACAQTGTGKTAAFLLPIMQRLLQSPAPERTNGRAASTRVLILAPTRELAVQIDTDFDGFAYGTSLSCAAVYGGVDGANQTHALRAPADVVVATPGRLMDHMRCGGTRFDGLEVLVLDEADRMLDMGFWPDVCRIVAALPAARQTLFFSATMSDDVFRSAAQIMRNPKLIQIGRTGGLPSGIAHHVHHVPAAEKASWLSQFLRRAGGTSLVFVRTKRGTDQLARRLKAAGVRCVALHADRTQDQRTAAMEGFRSGRYTVLVATDLAARGLDIEGVAHVINFQPPDSPDAYLHRVGRTGRAEASGIALTLAASEELADLREIERSLKISLRDIGGAGLQPRHPASI
jgi:ATP-dependent RNA helicase RhlE